MALIIHADGSILDPKDFKKNELGFTIEEVYAHQAKMLKECHRKLRNGSQSRQVSPNGNRVGRQVC